MLRSPVKLVRDKAEEWAERRQGADGEHLRVQRHRLYILPTQRGLVFSAMLFAMLLGAMNYNNSLGLALSFLLAGLGIVTMQHCHRNLLDLVVRFGGADPVFAGQTAAFRILMYNNSARTRYSLQVGHEDEHSEALSLAPGASGALEVELPTGKRGLLPLTRFSVSSTFPFGLFRTWTWAHMDIGCVVYPRPAEDDVVPPPERVDTGGAQDDESGDADFAGLRSFRPGDSPRHIAWKAFARGQDLLVKQYAGTDVATHWFDWESLPALRAEERLEQLCRWIVDAQERGHAFGLRLPGGSIEPNMGRAHARQCLTALALY